MTIQEFSEHIKSPLMNGSPDKEMRCGTVAYNSIKKFNKTNGITLRDSDITSTIIHGWAKFIEDTSLPEETVKITDPVIRVMNPALIERCEAEIHHVNIEA